MQSVSELIQLREKEFKNKIFLEFKDKSFTYEEMNLKANQAARGFSDLGLKKGDRIALLAPNSPEFIFLWWGILKMGAVLVPVNLRLTAQEVSYILNHSQAKAVVMHQSTLDLLPGLKKNCPEINNWLGLGQNEKLPTVDNFFKTPDPGQPPMALNLDDAAVILYTSGTTGFPKGVVHTHGNYLRTASSFARTAELKQSDRLLTANPLFHVNAQFYSTMGTLWAGGTFCLAEKFSASRMWDWTRSHNVNKVVMLLALTTILYGRPPQPDDGDNPVELVVAGGAPKGCYHDFEKRFKVKLQTLYSLTESPLAIMSPPGKRCVDGAVGKPMVPGWPGLKNRIIVAKADLSPCHPGETGEIMIQNQALFTHYLKDQKATEMAMAKGWLHTGDMGKTDEKGWIYFLGRGKDVIRKKGENISAAEVEGVLTAHGSVSQAAVIGVSPADALGEEEPMAFVIPAEKNIVSWPDLITHCQKNLADFKIPRFWLAVEDLPRNATNRVIKEKLMQGDPPETRPGVFDSLANKEVSG
ncbi:AMP-binding protein [Dethiosulfatarculus sandiegensis]|uniref:Crotonobetaine/carnitine-CoA ligase n=1 Tax=Dethiosulfatarculus sandiegensis TaxID=1429043 RepID=A0A0D2JXU0_9BACT|nr:AMP-binding protein [Dethiosulfatarculus sandiegensis]KIX14385.1 hypothetical protein X474_09340 [Dethiosulfatarculus sandiegensis]